MLQADIRVNLIDRLAPIFGKPRDADFLAGELMRHVPPTTVNDDLVVLADRIIATRKAKSFPVASELIAAVKGMGPSRRNVEAGTGIRGEIIYPGERPQIWILADDPRWADLCRIAKAADPMARPHGMTSKYAPGVGRFFNAQQVRSVPLQGDEQATIEALYAKARAGWTEQA